MAKEKRFPSPANVQVDKGGKTIKPSTATQPENKKVEGKHVNLVQVSYTGENHVVFENGTHALARGMNFVQKEVMEAAMKYPNIAKLIKDGKIIIIGAEKAAAPVEPQESA